ncbi:hypothetical protein TELCIR_15468 [Teladorsagia circumcincta]|uniref:Uncharacterized protein n=1 Tax=Teladorsagia circumcincta TaxID=45464 RepID=A0A2G9TZS5_TELCI|nr:hypothetical protein TELCIR_15468 [Teladorsagia circumcincta]
MLPSFERKTTPFFVQDEIITCSRALQSLSACQLLVRILQRHDSSRQLDGSQRKSKSTTQAKSDFAAQCEALRAAIRTCSSQLSSRLNEMEEMLKDNTFSLVPNVGTDWSEELYEMFASQNMVVCDRVYKSYFNSCADIRYFLEHTIC